MLSLKCATQAFISTKILRKCQAQLNAINKNRATLKLDVSEAKKNLQALQKEYNAAKKSG